MQLDDVIAGIITPAAALLPSYMDTPAARVQLLAIGQQESEFTARVQANNGPAHGLWQFEAGGGVKGVMLHTASTRLAQRVCNARGVDFDRNTIWQKLTTDDLLACAFARLLLWTDPKPLPPIGNTQAAWDLYARVWRPGRPHPEKWAGYYNNAVSSVADA